MKFRDLKVGDKFRFQRHIDANSSSDYFLYTKTTDTNAKFGEDLDLNCGPGSIFCNWEVVLQENKMNIIEALQALKNGKKIRLNYWDDNSYIYLNGDEILDEVGDTYEIDIDFNEVWCESTVKFIEVELNDEYTAKVYKNKIEVGCQTIEADKVEELIKAFKKVKE